MSKPTLAVLIALVAFAGVGAVFLLGEGSSQFALDQITTVEIDVDAGDIRVEVGTGSGVDVSRSSTRGAKVEERFEGGALRLAARCPAWLFSCRSSYTVSVPGGTQLRLNTGDGDVRVVGEITGPLRAETADGRIHVEGVAGPLTLRAPGGVRGVALLSTSVDAETGSGDVDLALRGSVPEVVLVRTTTGSAAISAPEAVYRVVAETGGSVDVGVRSTDSAGSVITFESESGDLSVTGPSGAATGEGP